MNKLEKLILIIHSLKEDAVAAIPTNVANTAGLGYDPEKETPPVFTKKRYATGGKGSRKWWLQYLKGK